MSKEKKSFPIARRIHPEIVEGKSLARLLAREARVTDSIAPTSDEGARKAIETGMTSSEQKRVYRELLATVIHGLTLPKHFEERIEEIARRDSLVAEAYENQKIALEHLGIDPYREERSINLDMLNSLSEDELNSLVKALVIDNPYYLTVLTQIISNLTSAIQMQKSFSEGRDLLEGTFDTALEKDFRDEVTVVDDKVRTTVNKIAYRTSVFTQGVLHPIDVLQGKVPATAYEIGRNHIVPEEVIENFMNHDVWKVVFNQVVVLMGTSLYAGMGKQESETAWQEFMQALVAQQRKLTDIIRRYTSYSYRTFSLVDNKWVKSKSRETTVISAIHELESLKLKILPGRSGAVPNYDDLRDETNLDQLLNSPETMRIYNEVEIEIEKAKLTLDRLEGEIALLANTEQITRANLDVINDASKALGDIQRGLFSEVVQTITSVMRVASTLTAEYWKLAREFEEESRANSRRLQERIDQFNAFTRNQRLLQQDTVDPEE